MKTRILICILMLSTIFSLTACGDFKNRTYSFDAETSEQAEEDGCYSGAWSNHKGLVLMLNPDVKSYTLKTSFLRVGSGSYTNSDGEWKLYFNGKAHKIKKTDENKIKIVAMEGDSSLSGTVLELDDEASFSTYTIDEFQGEWQNDEGTILCYDMTSKKWTCYERVYEGSSETDPDVFYKYCSVDLHDDYDGRGKYVLINDQKVYFTVSNHNTIGLHCDEEWDDEEASIFDGRFKRIRYEIDVDEINVTSDKDAYITIDTESEYEDTSQTDTESEYEDTLPTDTESEYEDTSQTDTDGETEDTSLTDAGSETEE